MNAGGVVLMNTHMHKHTHSHKHKHTLAQAHTYLHSAFDNLVNSVE